LEELRSNGRIILKGRGRGWTGLISQLSGSHSSEYYIASTSETSEAISAKLQAVTSQNSHLDSTNSWQKPVVGSREHGNRPSRCIKGGKFLEKLSKFSSFPGGYSMELVSWLVS
jgi:uncharacterized Zn finger protein